MSDEEARQLLKLIEKYDEDYSQLSPRDMTVQELIDDLKESLG